MKTTSDKIKMLNEVEAECDRFKKRIQAARERIKEDDIEGGYTYSSKQTAALKRAALDLKNELSRITKMGVFVFE